MDVPFLRIEKKQGPVYIWDKAREHSIDTLKTLKYRFKELNLHVFFGEMLSIQW